MNLEIKQELDSLRGVDGVIHPSDVIEAARHPASPLHGSFEWNDSEAADKYRLVQARSLIARYTITHEVAPDEYVTVRRYVALREDRGGYRTIEDIAESPSLREGLLDQLAQDLALLRARYSAYEKVLQLPALFREIDDAISKSKRRGKSRRERRTAA